MDSLEILRDILRRNNTVTTLDLTGMNLGRGLALLILLQMDQQRNATQTGFQPTVLCKLLNTTLQKAALKKSSIYGCWRASRNDGTEHHITDPSYNQIRDEGASLLATSLVTTLLQTSHASSSSMRYWR
jgi:hypothetical protein